MAPLSFCTLTLLLYFSFLFYITNQLVSRYKKRKKIKHHPKKTKKKRNQEQDAWPSSSHSFGFAAGFIFLLLALLDLQTQTYEIIVVGWRTLGIYLLASAPAHAWSLLITPTLAAISHFARSYSMGCLLLAFS